MNKFLSMAALALVGAMMTGCSSDEDFSNPQQPENKNNLVTLTTTVGFDDAAGTTRALSIEGNKGVKTFAAGETMAVIYNNGTSFVKAVSHALEAGDITNEGKNATFTFDLENPDKSGPVLYIYPAAMAGDTGVDLTKLNTQEGTFDALQSKYDLCTNSGAWDGENLPSLTLENQIAILAITLKNSDGSSDITSSITGLTLSDGTNTYNVTREAVAGPIYVAIFPTTSATIDITATDGTKNYAKTLFGKTYAKGNGYPVSWRMAEIISLSGRYPGDDELVIADGCILTDYAVGQSYKVSIADGATVTLRDVENNGKIVDNGTILECRPGIKCLGDATIILEGNNTVTGGDQYAGIYVPRDKTLTIRGTGSLNVTGGSGAAGIGGNATGDANCGSIVISGGTVTAKGGEDAAGIGLGANSGECKDITISGGTVTATGSGSAPGIGGAEGVYESITITGDVTKVTATKGSGAQYSIGIEDDYSWEDCGPITIGGTVYFDEGSFTNNDLMTSPFVYQPG